jgi:two-component system sensor histidine kinase DegS
MADPHNYDEDLPLSSMVEEQLNKYEQTQKELKEIDLLIQQTSAEVERLVQRDAQLNNYVRQMEINFDTIPRSDIKEAYEALNRNYQRLYTFRGQLEKLQSDQRNLERLSETQHLFLRLTNGLESLPKRRGLTQQGDLSDVIRVIRAQEAERQSLVRQMHDGPASSLSNFILQAEICQRFFNTDPDRARTELNALKGAAAQTFGAVKNFIFDLRPMMLDDLGVVPTMRRYVEAFQEQSGIPVSLTITGMERRLESYLEVTVFRTVQELMNNARRHAQPSQLHVQFNLGEEILTAAVEDNGRGFLVDDVRDTLGIPSIRERIIMLGGEFEIESSLGQGTRVEFSMPITEPDIVVG